MIKYARLAAAVSALLVVASFPAAGSAAQTDLVTVAAVYWDGSQLRDWEAVVPAARAMSLAADLDAIPAVLASGTVGRRGILEVAPVPVATNDPRRSEQWALDRLDYGKYTANGSGVVVAVIDTGVDAGHPDLVGKVLPGYDVYDENSKGRRDPNGHGTHVAGIIAASAGNATGIAGLAPGVQILPVRVLDETGYGDDKLVAKGVLWAVLNGAQVINLSLGGPDRDPLLADAIDQAVAAGVAVVVAAGNDGMTGSPVSYPGAHPSVTAVAATSTNDVRALFSTTGGYVDVAAPGMSILSTWPSSSYSYQSGTSMATPYVSAAVALVAQGLKIPARQALSRIVSSATDLSTPGLDVETGAGLIDPLAALGDGKPRTIDARGRVAAPNVPTLPELTLPPLVIPNLVPLPVPKLPPLPAMSLPKLEFPKLVNPSLPLPVIVAPVLPVQPSPKPSAGTPSKSPTKSPTRPGTSTGVVTTLRASATPVREGVVVTVSLRSDSGPIARRTLVVTSGGRSVTVVTDGLGRARTRIAGSSGTVRFAGDRSYRSSTTRWRLS